MKFEVLVATMDQPDDTFLDTMGMNSNAIVCNQNPDRTNYRAYQKDGRSIRWYDFQERGVGLNRNNALHRATADICLLSDDDVQFLPGYEERILQAFVRYPKADVIVFNIESADGTRRTNSTRAKQVHRYSCGKYGAVRIAFRRMSVVKNAISFNQLFGGGCMFTAGEDIIFLRTCIETGLRVIAVPDCILRLTDQRPSTWFQGHNQKFYEDFGSGYYCHFGSLAWLATFLQLIRRRKKMLGDYPFWKAWKHALDGIRKYKALR